MSARMKSQGNLPGAVLPTHYADSLCVAHFCQHPHWRHPHAQHTLRRKISEPRKSHFSLRVMATIALLSPQWAECRDEIVLRALVESVLVGYATHLRGRGIKEYLIQKKEELE